VTTSTGATAAGYVLFVDYTNANGASDPSAPSGCPCYNLGTEILDGNGDVSLPIHAASLHGAHNAIVATYQDGYNVIADTRSSAFVVDVQPLDQSISFTSTAPTTALVGGQSYTIAATASSTLPVSFSIAPDSTSVCSVSGSTVSFLAAGACVIAADQAGNDRYNPATTVEQTVTVGKGSQTVAFTSIAPPAPVVGGTYALAGVGGGSGKPVTFSVDAATTNSSCTVSDGTVTFVHVGSCVIDANQAGSVSYEPAAQAQQTMTVGKGPQTVSFSSLAPSHAAIGATYAPAATATSGLSPSLGTSGAYCSFDSGSSNVTMTHAGTCTVTADQAGSSDYLAAPQETQTITVDKTAQAITFTSTPPAPAVFGDAYTPHATGGASGNPVVFTIDTASAAGACWLDAGTVRFVGPGRCVIDADQAGASDDVAAPQRQQSFTIGFTRTLSGKVSGALTVATGQAVSLTPGTTIGGAVTVQDRGALSAVGTKIGGTFTASSATAIRLCGVTVGGTTTIAATRGLVVAGDDNGPVACAGNILSGSASITSGLGGVEFDGNTVRGPLTITGNTGTLPPPDVGPVEARGNKVSGTTRIQP
ncbi:MAG: hypothetical protein QOE86_1036, partial [Solirubrobacteraceae bacterium]|nr:hypothetical protein [Solirubrobacteraceae bacterium]